MTKGVFVGGLFPSSVSRLAYHFILDETMGTKRLIKTLFQMVKRFIAGSFRCNQPVVIIVSESVEDLAGIGRE